MNRDNEVATVSEENATAPSLNEAQRARVTQKLMDLARGVSNGAPLAMKPVGPHSSHSDNDGWI